MSTPARQGPIPRAGTRASTRPAARGLPALLLAAGLLAACARPGAAPADPPAAAPTAAPSPAARSALSDPGRDRGAAWIFDQDAPLRTFRVQVAPQDWAWLQEHATEETYVPARVLFEDQAWEGAAVRFKGNYGSLYACFDADGNRTCPKLSVKVSLNETDRDGRFFGLRKLVFNSCNRDPTYLRERLAYSLFRDAGVVAPRAVHALLQVNDEPPGLFLLVEDVDKEFLQDRFDDDEGNLYKEAWPYATDPAAYVPALQTNEDLPDVSRMVALAAALRAPDPGGFAAAVDPFLDRDAWTRYLATDLYVHDWDGITRFYCGAAASGREQCGNHNFYLYDDPSTGRFVLIPWDHDHSLEEPETDLGRTWFDTSEEACRVQVFTQWAAILAPQCDPLLAGLMLQGFDDYRAVLQAGIQPGGFLSAAVVQARMDRWRAQILSAVAADPLGPTPAEWRRETARLREIVAAQEAEVRAFLQWSPP